MNKKIIRLCALVWGISGMVILFTVLFPIAAYEANSKQNYPDLVSPLVEEEVNSKVRLEDFDYTKASNWFPEALPEKKIISEKISYYTISIPRLGIEDATVAIGGEDLTKSLIQFPGTAVPGKVGNSVIFGHSILPQFYDPKNYLAIFSTLGELRQNDEIDINYDGINYKYKVETKFEVKPTDIQILEQNSNYPTLSLVTCTPPGDPRKPKRLVIRAALVPNF